MYEYTNTDIHRVCGLFETFGALCADTQVGWRRSEAGLQVRHPFILILNHHNYNHHHKGRVKKWKFKMAFAMKGGGASRTIKHFEK